MTDERLKQTLKHMAENTDDIDSMAIAVTFKEKAGSPNTQFVKFGTRQGLLPLMAALKNLYRDTNAYVVRSQMKRKWAMREQQ